MHIGYLNACIEIMMHGSDLGHCMHDRRVWHGGNVSKPDSCLESAIAGIHSKRMCIAYGQAGPCTARLSHHRSLHAFTGSILPACVRLANSVGQNADPSVNNKSVSGTHMVFDTLFSALLSVISPHRLRLPLPLPAQLLLLLPLLLQLPLCSLHASYILQLQPTPYMLKERCTIEQASRCPRMKQATHLVPQGGIFQGRANEPSGHSG